MSADSGKPDAGEFRRTFGAGANPRWTDEMVADFQRQTLLWAAQFVLGHATQFEPTDAKLWALRRELSTELERLAESCGRGK